MWEMNLASVLESLSRVGSVLVSSISVAQVSQSSDYMGIFGIQPALLPGPTEGDHSWDIIRRLTPDNATGAE